MVSARDGHVVLSTGEEFDSNLIVWTVGNDANPMVRSHTDLPIDGRGMLIVLADLRVGTDSEPVPDAWGAGDDAAVPDLAAGRIFSPRRARSRTAISCRSTCTRRLCPVAHGHQPEQGNGAGHAEMGHSKQDGHASPSSHRCRPGTLSNVQRRVRAGGSRRTASVSRTPRAGAQLEEPPSSRHMPRGCPVLAGAGTPMARRTGGLS